MGWISVLDPGFLTTVQDLGRPGYAHLGISPGGAADWLSLRAGNRLTGNPDSAAALELTLVGGRFRLEQDTVFALTGSDFEATIDGRPVPAWRATLAPAGSELCLGPARSGARGYLCLAGGIQVERILGSASTDLRAGFGGFEGRPLRKGDRLELGAPAGPPLDTDASFLRARIERPAVRVTRGPQANLFPPDALQRLSKTIYTVREDSNRLGLRLDGEAIRTAAPVELLTEGVSLGAVQVPPDGQPIVLLVDQQTTGGYPKLANVIAADLPRVGQLRPRDRVRFAEVDLAAAGAARRELEASLDRLSGGAR